MFEPCLLYPQKRTSETSLRAAQTAKPSAGTQPTVVGRVVERADYRWKSNVARRYKANNSVPIAARQICLWSGLVGQIPDDSLTNRIFGFDYGLWRYWIPLPFDGNPILTLPDVVASAVTISVNLRTLDRHPDAAVSSLIPALSCRSCRPNAPFAELVRLSRTSIADEMREEHRRRVLGE